MSSATALYLVLYAFASVAGIIGDIHDRKPSWFVACAAAVNVIEAFLITAYWYPALIAGFDFIAPASFVLAMCWELYAGAVDPRCRVASKDRYHRAAPGDLG